MRFKPTPHNSRAASRLGRAFTLVEVLAAMTIMSVVFVVAMECFQLASRAGEYGQRMVTAARIGQSKLDELVATGQWRLSTQNGVIQEGTREFRWQISIDPWTEGVLNLITIHVYFPVQGREYEVRLSTLVDPSLQ
jgi:type II secretion system protein I